jgi:hypothetical protein
MRTLNVESFGALLRVLALEMERAAEAALLDGARDVAEDAARRLGTYQGAVGSFPAWQQLAQSTQNERVELGYSANDPLLRSGELKAAITMEARAREAVVGVPSMTVGDGTKANPTRNIGDIAVDMEFGTSSTGRGGPGIPERPFLGPAGFVKAPGIAEGIVHAAGDAFCGKRYTKWTAGHVGDIPF